MAAGLAGVATSAKATSYGNPDAPPQGAVNAKPTDLAVPGPHNDALSSQFPGAFTPPATDVGDMPEFWASFNNAPRRIQAGGWARQNTVASFPIATEISGVDMRLSAGAIREMHWHQAAEWAYVTYGSCRVTVIDPQGRAYVGDAEQGDLWYFPAGYAHSLQGLGPDGSQFLLCFDNGAQSEFNTLLLTQWMAHTPPDVLALNFGVPADTFKNIPLQDLYIFSSQEPQSLEADRAQVDKPAGPPPNPFVFKLSTAEDTQVTKGGSVKIVDSSSFKVSTTIAAAKVTVKPGGMRAMHWHPNADEWQYYIAGRGEMTIFNTGPKAVTLDFNPGDIGYVPRNLGHYIKNIGTEDLVFLEVFRSDRYQSIALSDWITHVPAQMAVAHLNVPADVIAKFPRGNEAVVPV